MDKFILEICTDSVESALAAVKGGAHRIELCSNLVIGGTTPSPMLFEEIRKVSDIRIHVLIRPRFGDFCYTDYECSIIKEEIKMFRELGAEGVVIGALNADGSLNMTAMEDFMLAAEGMSVTLHRAFDVCRNPYETLSQSINLGINTILTSGQKNSCVEGIPLLKELKEQSQGRISILAGAGVGLDVIERIYKETGITDYHMSGKILIDSSMKYRKEGVSMGLPSLSEYEIYRTDESKVRAVKELLESL